MSDYEHQLYVDSPVVTDSDLPPTSTGFFRKWTYIDDVCNEALRARKETPCEGPLTVLSVGCSSGAEVDTVLGHVNQVDPAEKVRIIGIDPFAPAIEQARKGRFLLNWYGSLQTFNAASVSERFSAFRVEESRREGRLRVDTTPLRRRHEVSFIVGDLTEEALELPEADIIFCNHVLMWLQDNGKYLTLVRRMANYLRPGGIMSLGAEPVARKNLNHLEGVACELSLERTMQQNGTRMGYPYAFRKPIQSPSI